MVDALFREHQNIMGKRPGGTLFWTFSCFQRRLEPHSALHETPWPKGVGCIQFSISLPA